MQSIPSVWFANLLISSADPSAIQETLELVLDPGSNEGKQRKEAMKGSNKWKQQMEAINGSNKGKQRNGEF